MFSNARAGPLIWLQTAVYKNIIEQHVVPSLRASSLCWLILMQDNTIAIAKTVEQFFKS